MLSGQEMDQTYYTVPGATDHSGKARWRHCWSHAIEVMCVQQTRYARVESVVWLTNKTNWQFIWWCNTTKRTFNKANNIAATDRRQSSNCVDCVAFSRSRLSTLTDRWSIFLTSSSNDDSRMQTYTYTPWFIQHMHPAL